MDPTNTKKSGQLEAGIPFAQLKNVIVTSTSSPKFLMEGNLSFNKENIALSDRKFKFVTITREMHEIDNVIYIASKNKLLISFSTGVADWVVKYRVATRNIQQGIMNFVAYFKQLKAENSSGASTSHDTKM